MTQQYSTPDGSVWALSEAESKTYGTPHFHRVDSPDNGHEDDFRAQKLNEVLKHWGPMSLYAPYEEEHSSLKTVLWGIRWHSSVDVFARRLQEEFRKHNLRLIKEKK